MEKYVIIVAGGSGKRMGSETPKQFLKVGGKPILMHTLQAFYDFNPEIKIVLVIPQEQFSYWQQLCKEYSFTLPHELVAGGKERFYSVKNGLEKVPWDSLVAIHDGVRPFPSKKTLNLAFSTAESAHSAVPVVPEFDSLRQKEENRTFAVNREDYWRVQTPQVFDTRLLKEAYCCEYSADFTDDASVFEAAGFDIAISRGNVENIKITTPMDLRLAELLYQDVQARKAEEKAAGLFSAQ